MKILLDCACMRGGRSEQVMQLYSCVPEILVPWYTCTSAVSKNSWLMFNVTLMALFPEGDCGEIVQKQAPWLGTTVTDIVPLELLSSVLQAASQR